MRTVFLFFQILLLFPAIGSAQSSWVRKNDYVTIETAGDFYFYKRTASGTAYYAMNSTGFLGGDPHINRLQRMDANGNMDLTWQISNMLWNTMPGFGALKIIYSDVLEAPFNKLAIAGVGYQAPSFGGTGYFPYLEVRNSAGAGLWRKMFLTPSQVNLTRVQQGPTSGYILMGSNTVAGSLTGLDSVGTILWSKSVSPSNEFVRTANNGYILAGNGVLRLDSLGNHIWYKRHGWFSDAKMVSELAGGNISIIGRDSIPGIGWKPVWMLLDASGNLLSAKYYSGPLTQTLFFAVACNAGGYAFLTETNHAVRLDAAGNIQWSRLHEVICPEAGSPIGFGEMNDGGFMIEEYGWTPVPNPPIGGTDLHVFRFRKTDPSGLTPCFASSSVWTAQSYSPVVNTLSNPVTTAATSPFNPFYTLVNPVANTTQIFDNCPTVAVCSSVVASFSASSATVCVGSNIVFTNTSQNWDYGAIAFNGNNYGVVNTGAQTTTVAVPSTPGIYQAVLVVNEGCCSDTTSLTITVSPTPVFSLGSDITICAGSSATLGPVSGTFSSYAWSTGPSTSTLTVTTAGTYTLTVSNGACTYTDAINVTLSQATVNLGPNITQCGNAAVILNAGAGFSSYNWSNGPTSQLNIITTSGTYTVTVTNANSCQGTDQIVITMNPLPAPNLGPNITQCGNAPVTLNPGSGFTTYSWSGGGSGSTNTVSSSGSYTVTVSNSFNCTASDQINVTMNPVPAPNLGADVTQCGNAPVTLNAGSGFTTYSWSGGGSAQSNTVSSSGSYTVTVSNSFNCTGTDQINVTMNPEPTPVISGTLSFCQGSSTVLDAGAGYASYQWNGGPTTQTLSVNAPGTYSVTVTNAFNCEGSTSVAVTQNPLPVASWTSSANNLQVSFTDQSQDAQSWFWNFGSGTSTDQNPVFNFPSTGIYSVCLYVTNSCGVDSLCDFLNLTSNSIVSGFEGKVLIYPNPSGGIYQIEITPAFPSEIELEITDALGRIVWQHPMEKINSVKIPVDLSGKANGVYFLKVVSGDAVSVYRLVKE